MALILISILFTLWITGFSLFFYQASQKNDYAALLGGLVPGTLILTYGFGSVFHLFLEQEDRFSFYQCFFNNWTLACIAIYVILASTLYYLSFTIAGKGCVGKKGVKLNWRNQFRVDNTRINVLLTILVPFDLFVRFLELTSGTYFNWVAAHIDRLPGWETSLFQLQSFLSPLLGVLLYSQAREKKWARIALSFLVILIFFEGDRSNFLIFLLPITLAYLYFNNIRLSLKIIAPSMLFIIFFFGFLGPLIQEVRYDVRDDVSDILNDPKTLPLKLVTEYIPNSLKISRLYGGESRRGNEALKNRLASWPAFWASINSRILEGYSFRGANEAIRSMTLVVPSLLYPGQKPIITAGPDNLDWFDLFVSSNDPTSTVFLDAFAVGGIWGLALFSVIYGALSGFWIRFIINRWNSFGVMVVFGLINIFFITRDSFATIFVSFRNSILFVLFITMLFWVIQTTENTLKRRRPNNYTR